MEEQFIPQDRVLKIRELGLVFGETATTWDQAFNFFREKGFDSVILPIKPLAKDTEWNFSINGSVFYRELSYKEARLACLDKLIFSYEEWNKLPD